MLFLPNHRKINRMRTSKLYSVVKKYFSDKPYVAVVYLYGSFAKGEEKKDSDIDLAILVDEKMADSSDVQIKTMSDLGLSLHKEVEAQNLNICKITFAYRVISEGKIIYQRSEEERIDFELSVMRNYFDMGPFLAEYGEQIANLARSGQINAGSFAY